MGDQKLSYHLTTYIISFLTITMKIMILLMSSKINLASTLNLKMFTNNLIPTHSLYCLTIFAVSQAILKA